MADLPVASKTVAAQERIKHRKIARDLLKEGPDCPRSLEELEDLVTLEVPEESLSAAFLVAKTEWDFHTARLQTAPASSEPQPQPPIAQQADPGAEPMQLAGIAPSVALPPAANEKAEDPLAAQQVSAQQPAPKDQPASSSPQAPPALPPLPHASDKLSTDVDKAPSSSSSSAEPTASAPSAAGATSSSSSGVEVKRGGFTAQIRSAAIPSTAVDSTTLSTRVDKTPLPPAVDTGVPKNTTTTVPDPVAALAAKANS